MDLRLKLPLEAHHQFQGATNDCAPFTTAMVIGAILGRPVDGRQLAAQMNRPRWRWGPLPHPVIRRIPNWATFPWGVVDILRLNGIRARWRFGASEADLFLALEQDRIAMPIVGEFSPLWAHIKPLVAHDRVKGWGFVDPGQREVLSWQSHGAFRKHWSNWRNLLVETLEPVRRGG